MLNEANGRVAYRFHARDLHLVMGPAARGTTVRYRVFLDGQPPGEAHGVDADPQGNGTVSDQRMYQLIRQPGPLLIACSRSSFSMRAWRPLCSPSADPRQRYFSGSPHPGDDRDVCHKERSV